VGAPNSGKKGGSSKETFLGEVTPSMLLRKTGGGGKEGDIPSLLDARKGILALLPGKGPSRLLNSPSERGLTLGKSSLSRFVTRTEGKEFPGTVLQGTKDNSFNPE